MSTTQEEQLLTDVYAIRRALGALTEQADKLTTIKALDLKERQLIFGIIGAVNQAHNAALTARDALEVQYGV